MVSKGQGRLHRIAPTTQGKHEVQRGASFEVIFRGRLVIRPVDKADVLARRSRDKILLPDFMGRVQATHTSAFPRR